MGTTNYAWEKLMKAKYSRSKESISMKEKKHFTQEVSEEKIQENIANIENRWKKLSLKKLDNLLKQIEFT